MTDNERLIGKVIAVESDRVLIELEKDSKSLTKTFVSGTYPIARINSYVILPVGSVSIVGVVTKVSMANEQVEITQEATLTLPQPRRTISVSMVGTIEKDSQNIFKFSFGISQFPVLNNPVWFILDEELDAIFDKNENQDYFVEIGKSTAYPDYNIKINPNKLFSRHLGILGNTGAGKSHTIASILQTILNNKDVQQGGGAHFIIFDTNGEYKQAFQNSANFEMLHIDQNNLHIPYWFMNFEDFKTLFRATEGSQIPVLHNALIYAKNVDLKPVQDNTEYVMSIIEEAREHYKNRRNKSQQNEDEDTTYKEVLKKDGRGDKLRNYIKGEVFQDENINSIITNDADSPTFFDINYLRSKGLNYSFAESGSNADRIRTYCETMIQRMDRFFNDPRYEFLFHKINNEKSLNHLSNFLRLCFGRFSTTDFKKAKATNDEYYFINKYLSNENISIKNKNFQVIIFDLSLMPYDILQNITALLGRLMLEFLQRIEKADPYKGKDVRGKFPVVLVLEEAHNYIPQPKKEDDTSVSREVFERIAREGRKYGMSLVVSSQRPSELSRTILAQCNSYIVHRIQNPEDQEYIRKLLPSISHELLKQLPVLGQGIALVFGDCVRAPMQVKVKMPSPTPKSSDPDFWKHWTNKYTEADEYPFENREPDFEKVAKQWEKGKSATQNSDTVSNAET